MDFPLYLQPKIYILHVIQIAHVQKKHFPEMSWQVVDP